MKAAEGMTRTEKLSLQKGLNHSTEVDHPWLVEHAAELATNFSQRVDGKTAYERLKVHRADVLECGCQVHHWVPRKRKEPF